MIVKSYHYHWNDRELKPTRRKIEPRNAVKSKTYSIFKLQSVNFFRRIIGRGLLLLETINLILETQNCKNTKIGWHHWNPCEKIPQNSCTSWYNLGHNNYVRLEMDFCPLCPGAKCKKQKKGRKMRKKWLKIPHYTLFIFHIKHPFSRILR